MIASDEEDVLEVALRHIILGVQQDPEASVIVLVPHAGLIDSFKNRLTALLPTPVVRVTTLSHWAGEQPLTGRLVPEIERLSLVFNALRERRWFEQQDRWVLAQEALALVDELTHWGFSMPQDPELFSNQLAQAYAARNSSLFQFEARLVHDLWRVLNQDPLELSPSMAYQQQLARLAALPQSGICYVIAPGPLTPAESQCLAALAERIKVVRIENPLPGREGDPCTIALRVAWDSPVSGSLAERADSLKLKMQKSPFEGRLSLEGMESIEREAHQGAMQVQQWLLSGYSNIAILAQDRVVSRRLRAILERQGVAIRDESGWTFSTTAASTVVMRWLDLVRSGGYYRYLQDLLHSPYLCGDWSVEVREGAIAVLEASMLQTNWISGLDVLAQRLEQTADDSRGDVVSARELIIRLQQAARLLGRSTGSFSEWLQCLILSLNACGMTVGLAQDAAGRELLEILDKLAQDSRHALGKLTLSDWVRALDLQFEAASFTDMQADSPVCMTQLSLTRLRAFDAVLVVGADIDHLPFIPLPAYFGDVVRVALGLPTRGDVLESTRSNLIELISRASAVKITWRSEINGERNSLAPLMQRLDSFHQRAWGKPLLGLRQTILAPVVSGCSPEMPAPRLQAREVPTTLSASGHNRLLACPYQFFAANVLGLGDESTIQETVDKRDYGQLIHQILYQFHHSTPELSAMAPDIAVQRLTAMTRSVFAKRKIPDEELRAWGLRWESRIPAYVAWAMAWEQDGWRWVEGEMMRERLLGAHTTGQVLLKGKLDRMDRRTGASDEELAILDYKLKGFTGKIGKEIEQGEDVQLAVYTLLSDRPVTYAAYLLLDDGEPRIVASPDPQATAAAVSERIVSLFEAIRAGAALPAHGVDQDCRHCEFGGLCRRDHWDIKT